MNAPDNDSAESKEKADVRAGYFEHLETDWRDVLRAAYEISAKHGFALSCRSADLLHVALPRNWESTSSSASTMTKLSSRKQPDSMRSALAELGGTATTAVWRGTKMQTSQR